MNWVWLTVGAWLVVAVLASGVLGRAIRWAEWDEVGRRVAHDVRTIPAGVDVIPLPTARRAGRSHTASPAGPVPPRASGDVRPSAAPAPRRSDRA